MSELLELLQAAKASGIIGWWGIAAIVGFWVAAKLARGVGARAVGYVTSVLKQSEMIRESQASYIKQLEERVEWLALQLAECQGKNS